MVFEERVQILHTIGYFKKRKENERLFLSTIYIYTYIKIHIYVYMYVWYAYIENYFRNSSNCNLINAFRRVE